MFISHYALLDSFQQLARSLSASLTDGRRRKVYRREGNEGRGRKIDKEEHFSAHSLQCDVISSWKNCKCVMFSAGLKFTSTPAATSSAAAPQFVLVL